MAALQIVVLVCIIWPYTLKVTSVFDIDMACCHYCPPLIYKLNWRKWFFDVAASHGLWSDTQAHMFTNRSSPYRMRVITFL